MAKKTTPKQIEQKQYHIYDPAKIKQTIEVEAKPKPELEDLQTIEKVGDTKKIEKVKKTRKKKMLASVKCVIG